MLHYLASAVSLLFRLVGFLFLRVVSGNSNVLLLLLRILLGTGQSISVGFWGAVLPAHYHRKMAATATGSSREEGR
jgi:hypothetical protein